jgi:streptogramin lyase
LSAATREGILPVPFDVDGDGDDVDGDDVEENAFPLESAMEATMITGHDQHDRQPSTTARSPRWESEKRGVGARTKAIAGIAAALILAVVVTTISTQLAARRTAAPVATATSGALTKISLPNASSLLGWTTAPDGSFWYATAAPRAAIDRVTPDGIITAFPIPADDTVQHVLAYRMAVVADGSLWLRAIAEPGATSPAFLSRMTPDGAFTTVPLPAGVGVGQLIAGPDGALWFIGAIDLNPSVPTPATRGIVFGRVTMDGHVTTVPILAQERDGVLLALCIGPDQALWYTGISSLSATATLTGRIGRISPVGQVQEFAVPYAPDAIASGADGALWYSELVPNSGGDGQAPTLARQGYLGRITTAGVVSELPLDPNEGVDQVVAGSDGAIWYTVRQDETGAFRRTTPSGGVKTVSTGGGAKIRLIAAVAGALWLLDDGNNLWRYRLPE